MGKSLHLLAALFGAVALVSLGTAVASAAPPSAYTCAGGDIPSGSYASITVTGACDVPDGAVINVSGNVYVAPGAQLDAQSAPSTITIGGNVTAVSGSLLGLGCQPPSYTGNSAHQCTTDSEGHSTVLVRGNITATGAAAVLLNGITVKGNVTLVGGGNEEIPWSIKNDMIGGNLTATGQTVPFFGTLFNTIGGNETLTGITSMGPDSSPPVYVVRNTIKGNLVCVRLAPSVSGGFIPGEVNTVHGHAIGQCATLV
jgi:hypothetical protein